MRVSQDPRARRGLLSLVLLVALVNAPLALNLANRWRVDRSGVETTAEVVRVRALGSTSAPRLWVDFTVPDDLDPEQRTWAAEVDEATFARAQDAGRLTARVVPGAPHANEVEGEVHRRAGLWWTLMIDGVLALLVWWVVRRRVRLAAAGDAGDREP